VARRRQRGSAECARETVDSASGPCYFAAMEDDLRATLAAAESFSDAIAAAIKLQKSKNERLTLGVLAKRAGIPSTGYIADLVSGRRRLNAKYRDGLLAALGIEERGAELVKTLAALDELDGDDHAERERLAKQRDGLRKLLRQQNRAMPDRMRSMFFAFEVFAAFGLSGQKATRADLREFFGGSRGIELEQALGLLMQAGLIERRDDTFHVVNDNVNFFAGEDGLSHLDGLTLALREAEERVGAWYGKKAESFFSSSIVSVKDATYRAALPGIKSAMLRMESDLESGEADRLVRFNVQIYPLS
jgi:hypothetical protein